MRAMISMAVAVALASSGAALAQGAPQATPGAPGASAVKAPHDNKSGMPAAGHNSFTKGQAKTHIEKEGYTHVTGLMKTKDGLWQGKAMKDGKQVGVTMDFQGVVASN